MPISIRPYCQETDFEQLLEISNLDYLDQKYSRYELLRIEERLTESGNYHVWTAFGEGHVAGFCSLKLADWAEQPATYLLRIALHPDETIGVHDQILQFLVREAEKLDAKHLILWTRDDHPKRMSRYANRGFVQTKRHPLTTLEVSKFEDTLYVPAMALLERKGVEFTTCADLDRRRIDWVKMLYDAILTIIDESPGDKTFVQPTYEEFWTRQTNAQLVPPETSFVAIHEGRMVGISRHIRSQVDPTLLRTGLTGVLAGYRGRHIATCLKVKAIEYCKANGIERIQTDNVEESPMLHLNYKLGFERVCTLIEYQLSL